MDLYFRRRSVHIPNVFVCVDWWRADRIPLRYASWVVDAPELRHATMLEF
jgi:hypothetical protein